MSSRHVYSSDDVSDEVSDCVVFVLDADALAVCAVIRFGAYDRATFGGNMLVDLFVTVERAVVEAGAVVGSAGVIGTTAGRTVDADRNLDAFTVKRLIISRMLSLFLCIHLCTNRVPGGKDVCCVSRIDSISEMEKYL